MNEKTLKKYSSLSKGKYRQAYGLFLAEGFHILEELSGSAWQLDAILIKNKDDSNFIPQKYKPIVHILSGRQFDKIATTKTPQGIISVVKIPPTTNIAEKLIDRRILIADGVKDPGNLGTIIRTAVAFGFQTIITTNNSADIYNPKTVRSTQGALFHARPIQNMRLETIKEKLIDGYKIFALSTKGDEIIDIQIPGNSKIALIVGAEISGVSEQLLDISDYTVKIPMSSRVESLNAAIAAGIALYSLSKK